MVRSSAKNTNAMTIAAGCAIKYSIRVMSRRPVAVCVRIMDSTSPLSRFATALSMTVSRRLSAELATPTAYGMLYCGNNVDFKVSAMLLSFRYRCAV